MKIYNEDCLIGMKSLKDESIDLIITDPPYNVNIGVKSSILEKHKSNTRKNTLRDSNFYDNGFNSYEEICQEWYRILKDKSHVYIFCSDRQINIWIEIMEKYGFKYNCMLIWLKNNSTLDLTFGLKYSYKTENCLFFRKGFKKLKTLGKSNVLKYNIVKNSTHPCEKPVELLRFLINQSSNKNDIVLDCFMGSGSIIEACHIENRQFIGYELNPYFYDVIMKRKQKILNQNTLFKFE